MRTFVIGSEGLVGRYFLQAYKKMDPTVFGTQHRLKSEPFYFDLEYPKLDHLPVQGYTHAIIAAFSGNLSFCQKFPEKTFASNVEGTLKLAATLAERGITPILFSSTYVFDGKVGGYSEESPVSPLNVYGEQKAALEASVDRYCEGNYLLLRLGKVFTLSQGDGTLLDEMIHKLVRGETIQAAYDQFLSPILIDDIIHSTQQLQKVGARGLFNLCGTETYSRLSLANYMAQKLSSRSLIQKISLDSLQGEIQKPKHNNLCCEKILAIAGIKKTKSVRECMDLAMKAYCAKC